MEYLTTDNAQLTGYTKTDWERDEINDDVQVPIIYDNQSKVAGELKEHYISLYEYFNVEELCIVGD